MKSTQDQPYRVIRVSVIVCAAIGGIGYLIARYLQPQWMQDFVQWLSPTIPTLTYVEQVTKYLGVSSLPAQVNVVYCVFGSVLWTAWISYLYWKNREYWVEEVYQTYLERLRSPPSKLKLLSKAIFALCLFSLLYGLWLFEQGFDGRVTSTTAAFYSGSFSSAIFWIIMTCVFAIVVPSQFLLIYKFFKMKGVDSNIAKDFRPEERDKT